MTKRKQRSPAQWRTLFVEHKQSNLTASEFCRQRNINQSHFSTRKRQLGIKDKTQSVQRPFIKIKAPHKTIASTTDAMVLVYQRTQLKLSSKVDAQWLAQLMQTLS